MTLFLERPWLRSFICVTWLIHMCDTDSFIVITRPIQMCDITHSYVWHYSTCVTWILHTCGMTHSHMWHDSFSCLTCLIQICDMSHSHVRHDSFICVTCMTHSNVWHDFSTCVTWIVHMCDMSGWLVYFRQINMIGWKCLYHLNTSSERTSWRLILVPRAHLVPHIGPLTWSPNIGWLPYKGGCGRWTTPFCDLRRLHDPNLGFVNRVTTLFGDKYCSLIVCKPIFHDQSTTQSSRWLDSSGA